MNEITLRPVGIVRTEASDDEVKRRIAEFESKIEVFSEFQEALDSLNGFSHIFVLSYLNKLRPDQTGALKIKPKHLLNKGFRLDELPLVGVFAIDSPTRPNPIGLSLVRLLRVDGRQLLVSGLDLFDGTPILDIKPYRDDYRAEEYALAEWYRNLRDRAGEEV